MKAQTTLGIITALSASLCCITPIMAIATGTSAVASTFSWIEPLRPYFIGSTVVILGFAWVQAFRAKKVDECGCEPKVSFFQSRQFLGIVTVLSALLIAFPSYSDILVPEQADVILTDQEKKNRIELVVEGMTCSSCELHIESEVKKIPGVSFVKASYEKGAATVEYDEAKVEKEKIITAINNTGYKVGGTQSSPLIAGKESCTAGSCQIPTSDLPKEISKNVIEITDISDIQQAFNKYPEKTKFVAILSSTCKWCIQGAESVQRAVVENMERKDMAVIVVWTNMLQSDGENTALRAASLFKNQSIVQFFDEQNRFGDVVAKTLSPKGEQAWDIYMFFDKGVKWNSKLPRPFEYAHQLSPTWTSWVDQSKYYCGDKLTERLAYITNSL